MMSRLRAVASVSVLLWLRDLAALFHASSRAVALGSAMVLLGATALGLGLAAVALKPSSSGYPPELKELMLRTAFSTSAVIGLLIIVVLAVSLPPRTALQSLVDLLPVRRAEAQLGQLLPVVALGAAFGLVLSALTIALASQLLGPVAFGAACLLVVGNMAALQMLGLSVFLANSCLLRRRLRIPQQYATTLSGALVMAAALAAFSGDVLNLATRPAQGWTLGDLLVTRLAVKTVLQGSLLDVAGVLLWWAASLVIFLATGRLNQQSGGTGGIRLLTGTTPPTGRFLSAVWIQLLIAVRTPQFVVTALSAVPLVLGARWLSSIDMMAVAAAQLASGLPAVPFALSMYALGRTVKYRWLGASVHGSWSWWVAPTGVAYFLAGAGVAVFVYAGELALGLVELGNLGSVIARTVLVLCAGLLGGALAPYSEEQGLSVAASGFLTGLLVIASTMFVSWARSATTDPIGILAEGAVAVLFFALYALIGSGQARDAARYL